MTKIFLLFHFCNTFEVKLLFGRSLMKQVAIWQQTAFLAMISIKQRLVNWEGIAFSRLCGIAVKDG